jgi:hypothetical protein
MIRLPTGHMHGDIDASFGHILKMDEKITRKKLRKNTRIGSKNLLINGHGLHINLLCFILSMLDHVPYMIVFLQNNLKGTYISIQITTIE